MTETNVHLEGALPASQRDGQPLSRKAVRQFRGPGSSIYPILSQLAVEDVFVFHDDFVWFDTGTHTVWRAWDSTNGTPFAAVADGPSGLITGSLAATDNAWIKLMTVDDLEIFNTDHRPTCMISFRVSKFDSDDDLLKVEFGFMANEGDADNSGEDDDAGQVATKATPTSNVNDYAVAILDTDDNTYWDVISDVGGTPTTSNNSSGLAWDDHDDVFQTLMVSTNEQDEMYAWVNGSFIGKTTAGPGDGVALGIFFMLQNREGQAQDCEIDYIRAWQERRAVI
jgi:hypothetical protein